MENYLRNIGEELIAEFRKTGVREQIPKSAAEHFQSVGENQYQEFLRLKKKYYSQPSSISPSPSNGVAADYAAVSDSYISPVPTLDTQHHFPKDVQTPLLQESVPPPEPATVLEPMAPTTSQPKVQPYVLDPEPEFVPPAVQGRAPESVLPIVPPISPALSDKGGDGQQGMGGGSILDSLVNMPVSVTPTKPLFEDPIFANGLNFGAENSFAKDEWSSGRNNESEGVYQNGPIANFDQQPGSILDSLVNLPVSPKDATVVPNVQYDNARGSFGSVPMATSTSFNTLQQHIDQLTEEKFELKRALDTQQKVAETLSAENETLTENYNRQASVVDELNKRLEQYDMELNAQALALENLGDERDSCRSAAQELQERIKSLVDENVMLEERVREVRIKEIRLCKQLEEIKEGRGHSDLASMKKDAAAMSDALQQLQEENSVLKSHIQMQDSAMSKCQGTEIGVQTDPVSFKSASQSSRVDFGADVGPSESPGSPQSVGLALDFLQSMDTANAGLSDVESRVLSSINNLLEGLEDQRRAMVAKLHASKAEIRRLESSNQYLVQKLAVQTQRFELAMHGSSTISRVTTPNAQHSPQSTVSSTPAQSIAGPMSDRQPLKEAEVKVVPVTGTERRGVGKKPSRWFFW